MDIKKSYVNICLCGAIPQISMMNGQYTVRCTECSESSMSYSNKSDAILAWNFHILNKIDQSNEILMNCSCGATPRCIKGWKIVCGKCGEMTGEHNTMREAILFWNTVQIEAKNSADKFIKMYNEQFEIDNRGYCIDVGNC